MTKYFKVVAKCGHVGRKKYVPITFAVKAKNGKEAAEIARWIPRVKHQHSDAILDCEKISYEEFQEINKKNELDDYLKCKNVQQQNLIDLSDRLVDDPHYAEVINRYRHIPTAEDILKRKQRIEYKKKRYENQFNRSRRLVGAY